tara:strand:- start:57 stop:179 length:123 start_codon:yes stop_codon:yes gene_type:complete
MIYDWITTTTIDDDSPYSHLQYIYVYDSYPEDTIIYKEEE